MKQLLSSFLFALVLSLFFGCQEGGDASQQDAQEFIDTVTADEPKLMEDVETPSSYQIQVEAVYASATRSPYSQYGFEKAFDGDVSTAWETPMGTGSQEGIMLAFPEKVFIGEIKVFVDNPKENALRMIACFLDGGAPVNLYVENGKVAVGKEVKTLFLKMDDIKTLASSSIPMEDVLGSQENFDPNSNVVLAEVELTNRQGQAYELIFPKVVEGEVSASSVLEPEDVYSPNRLFDNRREFAYAEGAKGNGIGESLKFVFKNKQTIRKLKLWNGYQRSQEHFKANARVKSFLFGPTGGEMQRYSVADQFEPVEVELGSPLSATSFDFKVEEVFEGEKYQDLVISELSFINDEGVFKLPVHDEELVAKNRKQFENGLLGKLLGKPLVNKAQDEIGDYFEETSIVLRPNNTFVYYAKELTYGEGKTERMNVVADGSWTVLKETEQEVVVKVFGKLVRLNELSELYKGTSSNKAVQIFKDELTITKNELRGKQFLKRIVYGLSGRGLERLGYFTPIHLDVKYATKDNFLGEAVYPCASCVVRMEVKDGLKIAMDALKEKGYAIKFFDCYRPLSVQRAMWKINSDPRYVANPAGKASSHNRGGAVDITLVNARTGVELYMGTPFDHFGEEAHHSYANLSDEVKANRKLLRTAMEEAGFKALETEWWHYSYVGSEDWEPLDISVCD